MKKFSKFLFILLILPLCFVFSSCKNNKNSDNNNNNGNDVKPGDEEIVTPTKTYSVAYDYNLPEGYEFLLNNFNVGNIEVGKSTKLALIPDLKLKPYFLGWSEANSSVILGDSISSSEEKQFSLKGNWDEDKIKTYYYSDGLEFVENSGVASVSKYTGTSKTVIIPKLYKTESGEISVGKIGSCAFENKDIEKVIVNSDELEIETLAFMGTKISSFDFEKVTYLGESAFSGSKITSVKFSDKLGSLSESVFSSCNELTTVDFAGCNTYISGYMFSDCTKLASIKNAENISYIGSSAFSGCSSLSIANFIGDKVEKIYEYAFSNCKNLVSATIPEKVLNLGTHIFDGCTKLESINLGKLFNNPSSTNGSDNLLKHIGGSDCLGDSLKTITLIGNSISRLPENYFDGLKELENFVMCDSVMYVEDYTFRECAKLKNITLSQNIILNNFSYKAFSGTKFLEEMNEPFIYKSKIMYVPKNITAQYVLPNTVTSISSGAFKSNQSLEKITIPSSVLSIEEDAFKDCSNLKEVVFEENSNITKISDRAFFNCKKLNSINLENLKALDKIGEKSFYGVGVSNFVIPSTATQISNDAFMYAKINQFAISGTGNIFKVEDGVLYQYENEEKTLFAFPREKDATLFVCPEDVKKIGCYAFAERNTVNIYFKNGISAMEWGSFVDQNGMTKYNTFENTTYVKFFCEQNTITTSETNVVIYKLTTGCTYNIDTNKITFDEGFELENRYCFVKFLNETDGNSKIYLAYFELSTDSEGNVVVVDGSLKTMATDLAG